LPDTHTPRTKAISNVPSSRETIDLVSDGEDGVVVKKREPSSSPVHKQFVMDAPKSVTVRKRSKQSDIHEDTPVQQSVKRQRSPSGMALSTPTGPRHTKTGTANGEQQTSTLSTRLANSASLTQIPDSEGEDNDDYFAGEDLIFDSDMLSPETKNDRYASPDRFPKYQYSTIPKEVHNIVPESPFREGANSIQHTNDRKTETTLRPPMAANPSVAKIETSASQSLSTPSTAYTV